MKSYALTVADKIANQAREEMAIELKKQIAENPEMEIEALIDRVVRTLKE